MESLNTRPIGVFDSGLGGLTVVRSIRKELPLEDVIYFGDTARVPYGNKSRDTIVRFSHEIMAFMMRKKVKMVVVACNTASSLTLQALKRASYGIPIIGVISPGVRKALSLSKNKRVGVIGTKSTISSKAYDKEMSKLDKSCSVFSTSCPLFVPLVENRHINDTITYEAAKRYLTPLKRKRIDALILGCTHYPILKSAIKRIMGREIELIDSSSQVAKEAGKVLTKMKLNKPRGNYQGKIEYFVSDDVDGFQKAAEMFLGERVKAKKAVV